MFRNIIIINFCACISIIINIGSNFFSFSSSYIIFFGLITFIKFGFIHVIFRDVTFIVFFTKDRSALFRRLSAEPASVTPRGAVKQEKNAGASVLNERPRFLLAQRLTAQDQSEAVVSPPCGEPIAPQTPYGLLPAVT